MADSIPQLEISDELVDHWRYLASTPGPLSNTATVKPRIIAECAAGWGWNMRTPEVEAAHGAGYEEACAILESLGDTRTADLIRKRRVQTTPQQQALAGLRCINDVTDGAEVVIPRHLLELTITALEEQTDG